MRLVVVGGIAAGLSAASRARRLDPSMEIVVLEKGDRISYGACGLPYLIEGQAASLDDLTVYTPAFFERERDIQIRLSSEVSGVQHTRREVLLAAGERIQYDKLVWATGARPRIRYSSGRVFNLHTDRDALRLAAWMQEHRPVSAAIVGGGYIGLEMAEALRSRGMKIVLHDRGAFLLRWSEQWLTKKLIDRLERCGVVVHLNSSVGDPEAMPEDLVLSAVGLKPNVEVLAEAGVELGRTGAIRTDDRMETSLGGVYAAGDCCETRHLVTDAPAWIPLGTTANKMGRVAGANVAGRRERFAGVTGTSILRCAGLGVGMTGLSESSARKEGFDAVSARIEAREKPKYFRGRKVTVELVADRKTRRLLGGAVVGDTDPSGRTNVIATALTSSMKADDFAGLDLAYAPPYSTAMDPLLVAAHQLVKLLD